MKRKMMLFPSMLFLLCLSVSSDAAGINAASCSRADVQAAINSAVDGDRVLVPAGNCTWTSQVAIPTTKGITLQGAGIDVTTIVTGFASGSTMAVLVAPGNSLSRVTGFTFDGDLVAKAGNGAQIAVAGYGLDSFRIDHNKIDRFRTRGVVVDSTATANEISGLIDNNIWDDAGGNVQGYLLLGAPGVTTGDADDPANKPHSRSLDLGGPDFIFIEDNVFNWATTGDGTGTARGGVRYVFRHNTLNGVSADHHGADSGGARGVHSFEIYNNTYNNTGSVARGATWRSGIGVFFNNAYTGLWDEAEIHNFRSCLPQAGIWQITGGGTGLCDGSNTWDKNTAGFEGWRCLDQVGALFGVAMGSAATSEPLYAWSNTKDASPWRPAVHKATLGNSCERYQNLHMIENRDFYNDVASFDGTVGVGVGTLAARPATCTPEVGYWATDTTTLYQCSSTDTWTTRYTPYTYPHPLRAEGSGNRPAPPTNLTVIVQ